MTENLITRLLAEAAARAEREKQQRKQTQKQSKPFAAPPREEPKPSRPSHGPKEYIYSIDFLLGLEESPLCADISHLSLPERDFYRLNARVLSSQPKNFNVRSSNGTNSRRRRRGGGGGLGAGAGNGNIGTRSRHYDRREEPAAVDGVVEEEDKWIRENDQPTGNSMEDFERWRLKMRIETFKRNGEPVPDKDLEEYEKLMDRRGNTEEKEAAPPTIDDEFASIPLTMSSENKSKSSVSPTTGNATSSSSKFSVFFHEDKEPENATNAKVAQSDSAGSSRLMSMLQAGGQPRESSEPPPSLPSNKDSLFFQSLLSKSKPVSENVSREPSRTSSLTPPQQQQQQQPLHRPAQQPFQLPPQQPSQQPPGMQFQFNPPPPHQIPPQLLAMLRQQNQPGQRLPPPPGMQYPPPQGQPMPMFGFPMGPPPNAPNGPNGPNGLPPFMMNGPPPDQQQQQQQQQPQRPPSNPQLLYQNQYGSSQPR